MPPPGKPCPYCGRMCITAASLEIHAPQCRSKLIQQWVTDPATRDRPMPPALVRGAQQPQQQQQQFPRSTPAGMVATKPSTLGGSNNNNYSLPASQPQQQQPRGLSQATTTTSGMRVNFASVAASAAPAQPLHLIACKYCQRNFSVDRIGKHESVCCGSQQARSVFNAKAQRLKDVMDEMMPPARRFGGGGGANRSGISNNNRVGAATRMTGGGGGGGYAPKRDWRQEHLEFQAAMRAAKRDAAASRPRQQQQQSQQQQQQYASSSSSGLRARAAVPAGGIAPAQSLNPRGAGPAPRRAVVGGGAGGGGIRPMMSSSGSPGGAPRQLNILPTNDTSAGMWQAIGRQAPSYGSYGPVGSRGTAASRRTAASGAGGGGGLSTGFW